MNGPEYTEMKADLRRFESKLDRAIAGLGDHGERIARLEQSALGQVARCDAHSIDIRELKRSDQRQDRAILKVSLISSGFVGVILLIARPLVERLFG